MDEDERLKPELLLDEETALDRMDRIAEKCGKNREQIRQFVAYFMSTRKTSAQLAKGEKPEDIKKQFQVELQKVPGAPKDYGTTVTEAPRNRAEKRMKAKEAKKSKAKPASRAA